MLNRSVRDQCPPCCGNHHVTNTSEEAVLLSHVSAFGLRSSVGLEALSRLAIALWLFVVFIFLHINRILEGDQLSRKYIHKLFSYLTACFFKLHPRPKLITPASSDLATLRPYDLVRTLLSPLNGQLTQFWLYLDVKWVVFKGWSHRLAGLHWTNHVLMTRLYRFVGGWAVPAETSNESEGFQ